MTLGTGFEKYSKTTRREKSGREMDGIVPWGEFCALIWPVYPKAGDGRPPKELEMMLRVYFLQQWFNLLVRACQEEALYDSVWMRRFAGIDLGQCPYRMNPRCCVSAICWRRMRYGEKLFEQVHAYLECQGIKIGTGTIVDATIIGAPPSPRNKDKRRDPDMHQTKKGNQWYFGMKAHIGVDSQTKLIHAVAAHPGAICMTRCACPTSCTGRRHASGVTRPIKDSARLSESMLRRRETSPTVASGTRLW